MANTSRYFPKTHKLLFLAPLSLLRPLNVCMWHCGRCGSTVLADLLRQDTRIHWGKEILEHYSLYAESHLDRNAAWKNAKNIIRYNKILGAHKIYGFEMKHAQLIRIGIDTKTAVEFAKRLNFNKSIILERKNYLRAVVSSKVGRKINKWHIEKNESQDLTKITLDPNTIENVLESYSNFYSELHEELDGELLMLEYERDILNDPLIGYRKVVNYLGLAPQDVLVRKGRTNPGKLDDIVTNLDEIRQRLDGSRFEWMTAE